MRVNNRGPIGGTDHPGGQLLARNRTDSEEVQPLVAVLHIDIRGIEEISETLGDEAGHDVVNVVTDRISEALPDSSDLSRVSPDQFMVVMQDLENEREAVDLASRISAEFSKPIRSGKREHLMKLAIGVAASDECRSDELVRHAALATSEAKAGTPGTVTAFRPRMQGDAIRREQLPRDLDYAVERGEMVIRYQPVVDLDRLVVVGAEALARWRHPVYGLIPPSDFIPMAERGGQIGGIGRWVLSEACLQAAAWGFGREDTNARSISVNVSALQLTDPAFVEVIRSALTRSGLAPSALVLEITESALMEDSAPVLDHLGAIRELGARIALDDFGTGYSSMSRLRMFPVDVLKIDRSFIEWSDWGDRTAKALVRSIASLCAELDMMAVAEGIETPEQAACVTACGCRFGQGYLLGRPMRAPQFANSLSATGLHRN